MDLRQSARRSPDPELILGQLRKEVPRACQVESQERETWICFKVRLRPFLGRALRLEKTLSLSCNSKRHARNFFGLLIFVFQIFSELVYFIFSCLCIMWEWVIHSRYLNFTINFNLKISIPIG